MVDQEPSWQPIAALPMILAIAAELREGTIDRIMAKSDLELGLEALLYQPA